MKYKLSYLTAFIAALLLAAGLSACKSESVVSDSSSAPAASSSGQSQPATQTTVQPAGSPAIETAAASQPTPSPTIMPILKEAQAKPGVPVAVPEIMKRPLTKEEMEKALQQMPPEVRARIKGMQAAPQGVKPQATPKQ